MKSVILEARLQATLRKKAFGKIDRFLKIMVLSLCLWVLEPYCNDYPNSDSIIPPPNSPMLYFTCATRTSYQHNELSSDM